MKKILFTLLLILFLIPSVNAEEFVFDASNTINNVNSLQNAISRAYEIIKDSSYKYYTIELIGSSYLKIYLFDDVSYSLTTQLNDNTSSVSIRHFRNMDYSIYEDGTEYSANYSNNPDNSLLMYILDNLHKGYSLYDTNFNYKTSSKLSISGIYSDNIELNNGDSFPTIKQLLNYNSWNDYFYTTVDLDDYEYVILNLKDYSKKEAFETNLQVKGSIGITPLYNYGQAEKSVVTDRCNLSYLDFTNYRFFVLKNDLINNSVYIVKNCQEDSSSFRYDSSIFDITYVTTENVNDPVVTFGGVEYHTIPFNKLSNSVNKNEEDGFIPGVTEQFDPFGSVVEYVSSFWNSLTTFMGLVTKFFNTLPIEIRAISITMFTTAITLGVIKFIKS